MRGSSISALTPPRPHPLLPVRPNAEEAQVNARVLHLGHVLLALLALLHLEPLDVLSLDEGQRRADAGVEVQLVAVAGSVLDDAIGG